MFPKMFLGFRWWFQLRPTSRQHSRRDPTQHKCSSRIWQCFSAPFSKNMVNQEPLHKSLHYLLLTSEVDDTEIFKICLEYWNALAADLHRNRLCFGFNLLHTWTMWQIWRICSWGKRTRVLPQKDQGQGKINWNLPPTSPCHFILWFSPPLYWLFKTSKEALNHLNHLNEVLYTIEKQILFSECSVSLCSPSSRVATKILRRFWGRAAWYMILDQWICSYSWGKQHPNFHGFV